MRMLFKKTIFSVSTLFLLVGGAWGQVRGTKGKELYVPDEILITLKGSASIQNRAKVLGALGEAKGLSQPDFYKIKLKGNMDVLQAVEQMKKDPSVLSAQPNFRYYALGPCFPNPAKDPYYASPQNWPFIIIHAPEAWGLFPGCSATPPGSASVTVAVLDSGIANNNLDLPPSIIALGYNATTDYGGPNANTLDNFGHGTYVAGIIAAQWNTPPSAESCGPPFPITGGMVGLAGSVTIMPVKILASDGSGTTDSIVAGTNYAVSHGARVLNFSLGSSAAAGLDSAEQAALDNALANNCVIVASAGNDNGGPINFPAAYPPVIAVGATDQNDQVACYSNVGPGLDLVAPGGYASNCSPTNCCSDPSQNIFSTFLCPSVNAEFTGGIWGTDSNYGIEAGTSASAPFVSGTAALILAMYPTLTNTQVADRIINNADSLNGNQGWDPKTGYGRLNVYRALLPVASQTPEVTRYLNTFNSPNPFYPDVDLTTNITLAITQAQAVDLTINDSSGEVVLRKNFAASDLNQNPDNPQYKSFYIPWDGRNGNRQEVKTGIYFYSVKVGSQVGRNKIAVIQGSK